MTSLKTNLLTEKDIEFVRTQGVPAFVRDDLFALGGGRALVPTLKGHQFFQYVFWFYGVAGYSAPNSHQELLELCDAVNDVILDRAEAVLAEKLVTGKLPAQDREYVTAFLYGDADASMTAAVRAHGLKACGENVIPVAFGK